MRAYVLTLCRLGLGSPSKTGFSCVAAVLARYLLVKAPLAGAQFSLVDVFLATSTQRGLAAGLCEARKRGVEKPL